jgi:hypothetical protein
LRSRFQGDDEADDQVRATAGKRRETLARAAMNITREQEPPYNYGPLFRLMAIIFGTISIWMGRTAISQAYLWNSGYNPRIGDDTTGTTLSWASSLEYFLGNGL